MLETVQTSSIGQQLAWPPLGSYFSERDIMVLLKLQFTVYPAKKSERYRINDGQHRALPGLAKLGDR